MQYYVGYIYNKSKQANVWCASYCFEICNCRKMHVRYTMYVPLFFIWTLFMLLVCGGLIYIIHYVGRIHLINVICVQCVGRSKQGLQCYHLMFTEKKEARREARVAALFGCMLACQLSKVISTSCQLATNKHTALDNITCMHI